MTLHGHPIAKALESWWRDHAGRYDDPEWRLFIETYGTLIRQKYAELLEEHNNGGRFGMSKAGGCTRAAQLKLLGAEAEPLSGSSRATFFIGHTVEIMALSSLIVAGYSITDIQTPISIDPIMLSARDATITLDGKSTLLSVKSSSYKKSGAEWRGSKGAKEKVWVRRGFPELPFQGVRNSQPAYWAQLQAECYAGGYDQALILFVAKDMIAAMKDDPYLGAQGNGSLTFYAELIPADDAFAVGQMRPVWDEAWENVQNGFAGRGYYVHKTFNRYVEVKPTEKNGEVTGAGWNVCDYCDLRKACDERYLADMLQASIAIKKQEAVNE